MRVVLVNWAKIWDGASHGGGVNGYAQSLALELIDRGHEVISVCSGQTYLPDTLDGDDAPGACRVRRHRDWLGVRVFEVVNSPVLSPSQPQFADPMGEVSAPELEDRFERLLNELSPDVVHFHNLEGFSAGCVHAARRVRRAGGERAAVVFSLHNYHTICPQVYLLHKHRTPCQDFEGGRRCSTCIEAIDPSAEKRRLSKVYAERARAEAEPLPEPPPPRPYRFEMATWRALLRDVRQMLRPIRGPQPLPPVPPERPTPLPGEDADQPRAPLPIEGDEVRGQAPQLAAERDPPRKLGPDHPDWQTIDNEVTPQKTHALDQLNDYGRRRGAMIEALNACDRVLSVSMFVRDKFASMGVEADKLENLQIGTRHTRLASLHADVLFDPPPIRVLEDGELSRPVRVVFMGYNNWAKGLPMLGDALELMPDRLLRRLHLSIYAKDGEVIEWKFRRMEPRLGGLAFQYGYQPYDVPWICGGKDLGLTPSVWWDNGPQTVFEFQSCGLPVLAARLGGIPDAIRDGVDGVLFRGNDRHDFVDKLTDLLEHPEKLVEMRRHVRPPKDIGVHADEMVELYRRVSTGLGAPAVVTKGPDGGARMAASPESASEEGDV
ncbi:MAG: glycosyltransferase [Planctomycetota bacterium]